MAALYTHAHVLRNDTTFLYCDANRAMLYDVAGQVQWQKSYPHAIACASAGGLIQLYPAWLKEKDYQVYLAQWQRPFYLIDDGQTLTTPQQHIHTFNSTTPKGLKVFDAQVDGKWSRYLARWDAQTLQIFKLWPEGQAQLQWEASVSLQQLYHAYANHTWYALLQTHNALIIATLKTGHSVGDVQLAADARVRVVKGGSLVQISMPDQSSRWLDISTMQYTTQDDDLDPPQQTQPNAIVLPDGQAHHSWLFTVSKGQLRREAVDDAARYLHITGHREARSG